MRLFRLLIAIACVLFGSGVLPALAAPVKTPHVEAELIAANNAIAPGEPAQLALRLKIIDHWHTYWRNPGDSGLPTKLKWTLPPGFAAGPIEWPFPKKLPLGPLMNFGYEGEVLHLVTVQVPASLAVGGAVTLKAKADWLVCADVCIPEEAELSIVLPVVARAPLANAQWKAAFARARAAVPSQSLVGLTAQVAGSVLTLEGAASGLPNAGSVSFYPFESEVIANAAAQKLTRQGDRFSLTITLAEPVNKEMKQLEGVFVADADEARFSTPQAARAVMIAAPVVYAASKNPNNGGRLGGKSAGNAQSDLSLLVALGLAFVGGLILNLMPCVFPVLGIKVMGFVQSAARDVRLVRAQGVAFLVGVMLSFWVLAGLMLALRAFGESIGWGFQLQEPVFVVALTILFFVMALNLTGLFEIGTRVQSVAGNAELSAQRSPVFGAFASGVLATLVATPCMAPGLGASVGFTLDQSPLIAILVFSTIALGLALPIVLLSFFPQWLRWLPRPGAWMETFKQVMSFPLFATCVWLVWVLGSQTSNDSVAKLLFGLVLIALAAWIYGRLQAKRLVLAVVGAAVLASMGVLLALPSKSDSAPPASQASASDWVPFSPKAIADFRADGKGVFVDFTATWCITCQVNKRTSLNHPDVVAQFTKQNVVRMQADWTRKDPVITEALASFGRNGVPLYVFYPAKGEPVVLPEVLTPSLVIETIQK